jgi:hypothetical protein
VLRKQLCNMHCEHDSVWTVMCERCCLDSVFKFPVTEGKGLMFKDLEDRLTWEYCNLKDGICFLAEVVWMNGDWKLMTWI